MPKEQQLSERGAHTGPQLKKATPPAPRAESSPSSLSVPPLIQRARHAPGSLAPSEVLQLQRTLGNRETIQLLARAGQTPPEQASASSTGLPANLRAGVEHLSGLSMDDVSVHYNSTKPAQLQAHAYAQGTDIHLGPGQEQHLPHEAWHVVQQKEGRVQPTARLNDTALNDSPALEQEADRMGARASGTQPLQRQPVQRQSAVPGATHYVLPAVPAAGGQAPVQRVAYKNTAPSGGELDVTEEGSAIVATGWIGREVKPTGLFASLRSSRVEQIPVHGSIDFHADEEDLKRLVIGTIKSQPKRTGAGTLLVFHLAKYALSKGYTTIGTDLSALEEGTPEFYQSIGLKPPKETYDWLTQNEIEPDSQAGKNILFAGRLDGGVVDVFNRAATKLATSPWQT